MTQIKQRAKILGELNILEQQENPEFEKIQDLRNQVRELNEKIRGLK